MRCVRALWIPLVLLAVRPAAARPALAPRDDPYPMCNYCWDGLSGPIAFTSCYLQCTKNADDNGYVLPPRAQRLAERDEASGAETGQAAGPPARDTIPSRALPYGRQQTGAGLVVDAG